VGESGEGIVTALICGGSTGMGLATASRFAREGASVAIFGRSQDGLDLASTLLEGDGAHEVLALSCDVTSTEAVEGAVRTVAERFGHLNALVNAVGPSSTGGFEELSDDAWATAFDAGVLSSVRTTRACLPLLRRAPWARVVNVTATSVKHQSAPLVAYTAAKAALASVTKNLARALGAEQILVNAVAPGAVLSDTLVAAVTAAGADGTDPAAGYRVLEELYGHHADLRRLGTPSEVAEVIYFCASEANSYMTGAQLNVDGGTDFS
jgi:NAD(P)-dependent dehydrogenase (short-subunit alcohol dehydrogenase family)